jgi:hypothetical protein
MAKGSTKAEKEYMGKVAALGCIICKYPAEVHHATGLQYRAHGKKASCYDTIPLCATHHRLGGFGVAVHAGVKTWEKTYGTQAELIKQTREMLGWSE